MFEISCQLSAVRRVKKGEVGRYEGRKVGRRWQLINQSQHGVDNFWDVDLLYF
jgi:hypothetical protein